MEDYYSIISGDQYLSAGFNNYENNLVFSRHEVDYINSVSNDIVFYPKRNDPTIIWIKFILRRAPAFSKKGEVSVTYGLCKFADDWYTITKYNAPLQVVYYKCDQWDGFKRCLGDLIDLLVNVGGFKK